MRGLHHFVDTSEVFFDFLCFLFALDNSGDLAALPIEIEALVQLLRVVCPVVLEHGFAEVPRRFQLLATLQRFRGSPRYTFHVRQIGLSQHSLCLDNVLDDVCPRHFELEKFHATELSLL